MKTLCVVVVALSLISGCQSASLVCETLGKPVDRSPDFPGRWHLVATSSDSCLLTSVLFSFLELSAFADIYTTDKLNNYNINFGYKTFGHCGNATQLFLIEKNTIQVHDDRVDREKNVLLHTGCHDCFVVKMDGTLHLYSRRITITAAEMMEFQKQADCLGLHKPTVLNTDHDRENCKPLDDINTDETEFQLLAQQRLRNMVNDFYMCAKETYLYYPRLAYEWAQQTWANLW
ncbi:uncharacterized protein LOC103355979 [Stegastes partitus]|uniref:Uncharacterized protein LOC103355979 n=1 Tax=Stegastes partitus TaxID=144197 RepID=A0A9Y4MS05_9TELE|nr:PREDICTED: uncharacterized protein LOC103355979 [Stegastes partitus]